VAGLLTPVIQRWLDEGKRDPDALWARGARELPWFRTWDRVFDADYPTFRWFPGALTNLAYNALDHHVNAGRGGHAALVYISEAGDRRVFTYAQLLHAVKACAAALRARGISKGDRITIYMPTCPEAIVVMLAAVRIGAIHSVVFAGFGARALGDRIQASGSRLVFTADATFRKGKAIPLKTIVDDALNRPDHVVEHVIVLDRGISTADHKGPRRSPLSHVRDIDWDTFLKAGTSASDAAGTSPSDAAGTSPSDAARTFMVRDPVI
jgi:acetyl-CoA synthetase